MPDASAISQLSSLYGAPEAQATRGDALGKDAFLNLLVAQLQNQNPLEPVDNTEFVAQLAQFSSLEQLVGMQSTLESVYYGIAAMNNASMANLLGTDVVARGDTFHYDGEGGQNLLYDASTEAVNANLTVYDDNGAVVWQGEVGPIAAGEGHYGWDGTDVHGNPVAEGDYTFLVTATDGQGDPVAVQTLVQGLVDAMDYSTGSPLPSIDGIVVQLGDIVRLTTGGAP